MTLAMLHIERARTRMPLVCTVISLLVLTVFGALSYVSWLIDTNASRSISRDVNAAPVPQTATSATTVSAADQLDRYETESWVRHGREF